MSDTNNKLQQDFTQLPDAEPPFGHDTRIKALAREQLQSQRDNRAKTNRWAGAVATLGCAAIVFFVATPLLQKPVTLESIEEISDVMAGEEMISKDAASSVEPTIQSGQIQQKSSAGGGSEAIEFKRAEPAQLVVPSTEVLTAPTMRDEVSNMVGRSAKTFSGVRAEAESELAPTLTFLLSTLEQAEKQSDVKKVQKTRDEIMRLYPDYKLDKE